MDDLWSLGLVDLDGLLLMKYRTLDLDETQVVILLLIMHFEKNNMPYITPQVLKPYLNLDDKILDGYIVGLLSRKLIVLNGTSLSCKPLQEVLKGTFTKKMIEDKKGKSLNLVEIFEHEFARALTPMEIETLKEWKQCHYSDQMIVDALKEATLSNVHNMRYIEKILIDWARHGVKTSGRERVEPGQAENVQIVTYPWWED